MVAVRRAHYDEWRTMAPEVSPTGSGEKVRKRRNPYGASGGVLSVAKRKKANLRERNRMHGLNDALDRLRMCVPLPTNLANATPVTHRNGGGPGQEDERTGATTVAQRLSKIDTLRLAKNYILVLLEVLRSGRGFRTEGLVAALANRLSQNTVNLLRTKLSLDRELRAGLLERGAPASSAWDEGQEETPNHRAFRCYLCSASNWPNQHHALPYRPPENAWTASYGCALCGCNNEEEQDHRPYLSYPNAATRENMFEF